VSIVFWHRGIYFLDVTAGARSNEKKVEFRDSGNFVTESIASWGFSILNATPLVVINGEISLVEKRIYAL
jgi:hypothetical protein